MLALPGFSTSVTALAFSPDGRYLAAGGFDGNRGVVKVWDATPLPR
jgi:WD40 repeat protein